MTNSRKSTKIHYISLLLSGTALGLSFPKAGLGLLAWVSVIPLLIFVWDVKKTEAFKGGVVYGMAYFATTLYWVEHSIRVYGHLPVYLSIPLVILLCLVLSLYVGLFSVLFNNLYMTTRFPALLLAPVLWVSLDLLRTYLFTGFPWASIGYSQYEWLSIIQIADLTGVYGVSFLVVAVNGVLTDIILYRRRMRMFPLFPAFPTLLGITLVFMGILGTVWYGHFRLNQKDDHASQLTVSLVQGNIDQSKKWGPGNQKSVMTTYRQLTRSAVQKAPELVIWPETSVPFIFNNDQGQTEKLKDFVRTIDTPLLFGTVEVTSTKGSPYQLANSAVLLDATGNIAETYKKIHLVPFGEYIPWMLPLDKLVTAIGDFSPGTTHTVMKTGGIPFSTVICYEIIFPELVRKFVNKGARFVATITNDAWFGKTSAPYQHFSMAVFRAVENRVPVVRAANTGISGFIDDRGRIIRMGRLFREEELTETISIRNNGRSFYTRFGNVFGYLCVVAAVMIIIFKGDSNE